MSANDAASLVDQSNVATRRNAGEFVRGVSAAKHIIPCEEYPIETGRYHLYVAFNCPWCHRVALARALLGLESVISMDVAMPIRSEEGHPEGEGKWVFQPEGVLARNKRHIRYAMCTVDSVQGLSTAVEIYRAAGHMTERSLPMLYDKQTKTVVNNESFDIVRMMSTAFARLGSPSPGSPPIDLYPMTGPIRSEIDELNDLIYHKINNGAYKAGFGSNDQDKYETAAMDYFAAWDELEALLSDGRNFLCGNGVTEADLKLFPTLFRHDSIYYVRMKLNQCFVYDYPHLWRWLCTFYALPGVSAMCPLDQMRQGYFGRSWNNTIPTMGPTLGGKPWMERLTDPTYAERLAEARRQVDAAEGGGAGWRSLAMATAFVALGAGAAIAVLQRRGLGK